MDVTCYGVLMFYIEISVFPGNSECRLPLHWGYGIHKNNINIKIKDQTYGFKEFQLLRQSFKEPVIYIYYLPHSLAQSEPKTQLQWS